MEVWHRHASKGLASVLEEDELPSHVLVHGGRIQACATRNERQDGLRRVGQWVGQLVKDPNLDWIQIPIPDLVGLRLATQKCISDFTGTN